jgi:uncharacterized protein YdeI (YjbR/CyaY-like superfamily)
MNIGETLYVKEASAWRKWLEKNHEKKKEIWLIYYKKNSKKERIPYVDAVKEALCFGWIDSTVKGIDEEKYAQRFSPRRKGSPISALNMEHIRRLMKEGKMTPAGLVHVGGDAHKSEKHARQALKQGKLVIPAWIEKRLKENPTVWKNFQKFPVAYKKIRIDWISLTSSGRQEVKEQRLRYFIKMTEKNKKYGMLEK